MQASMGRGAYNAASPGEHGPKSVASTNETRPKASVAPSSLMSYGTASPRAGWKPELVKPPKRSCVLSVISFCNPITVFWSTGNMASAIAFCTMSDLLSAALRTIAWLLFSIVQQHGKDSRKVGSEAVITNTLGVTLLGVFIAII
ncbi:hypothetical protein ACP4OV_031042 [Aristida adscensionis]